MDFKLTHYPGTGCLDALYAGAYYRPETSVPPRCMPCLQLALGALSRLPKRCQCRAWRILSIIAAAVAVILSLIVFGAKIQRFEVSPALLFVVLLAICTVIFVHGRFLLHVHQQHRQTSGALLTTAASMPRVHGSEQPSDRERQERFPENAYRPSFCGIKPGFCFLTPKTRPNYTSVLSSAGGILDRLL
jgi:hypothetical protein